MPRYEVVNAEGVVLGRAEVADGPVGTEAAQDLRGFEHKIVIHPTDTGRNYATQEVKDA